MHTVNVHAMLLALLQHVRHVSDRRTQLVAASAPPLFGIPDRKSREHGPGLTFRQASPRHEVRQIDLSGHVDDVGDALESKLLQIVSRRGSGPQCDTLRDPVEMHVVLLGTSRLDGGMMPRLMPEPGTLPGPEAACMAALGWLGGRTGRCVLLACPPWDDHVLTLAEQAGLVLHDARHGRRGAKGSIVLRHPPRLPGPVAEHVAVMLGPEDDDLLLQQASGMALVDLYAVRFPSSGT